MAAPQNFRTAFNGFKREDVVQYIEYLNAKYTAQVNQLTSDNAFLTEKLEALQDAQVPSEDVSARYAELNEMLVQAATRIQELEQERDAAIAQRDAAVAERDSALEEKGAFAQQTVQQYRMEQELEAYRRAERAERVAKERAEQLYRKANGVLGEATAKVDSVSCEVGTMADQVIAQLEVLKSAVSGSKQALQEAAATLYTLRSTDPEA